MGQIRECNLKALTYRGGYQTQSSELQWLAELPETICSIASWVMFPNATSQDPLMRQQISANLLSQVPGGSNHESSGILNFENKTIYEIPEVLAFAALLDAISKRPMSWETLLKLLPASRFCKEEIL